MRLIMAALMSFLVTNIYAGGSIMPPLCKPVMVDKAELNLTAKKPALVLIYNHSNSELWLSHPVKNIGASAGWTSQLESQKWSALALNKKDFKLTCIESKPGHEQEVSCQGLVTVCKWPNQESEKSKGTYWAGENMSLPALKSYLGDRGFKLPAK